MNSMRRGGDASFRSGITMLEVLVVIGIIAVLAALILPAVQAAREVSRRAQCTSHLRQLGQGIAAYEGVRGHYPIREMKTEPYYVGWSQFVELLPHVGEGNVYDNINFDKGIDMIPDPHDWYLQNGNPAVLTKVPLFLCPSDISEEGTNYRFCVGSLPAATRGNGAFSWYITDSGATHVKPSLVKDGESNTVAMSEKLVTPRGSGWSRLHNFWYSGYNELMGQNPATADEMIEVCKLTPDDPLAWHPYSGQSWSQCWFAWVLYNHVAQPNSEIPDCTPENANPNSWLQMMPAQTTHGMFTARSWHPGGVNVLFLDGHVRFISDSVDLAVWRGMASIDGGEKVDLP